MTKGATFILALVLAMTLGATGHWTLSKYGVLEGSTISMNKCIATTDTEFLTLDYSFAIHPPKNSDPFVMVHASVLDDASTTSRYMGHAGSIHRGGSRSGQIQERLHILNKLAEPYVVVVVTAGNSADPYFERRAFVIPIHDGDQGESADAFGAADF